MTSISAIATAINNLAPEHQIGKLQELRTQMKELKRTTSVIFDLSRKSVNEKEGWAFHTGGREELQFNIGIEGKQNRFRFGVAFSLEPSRSLHDITPLLPKIERFNEFVRNNSEALDPFRMWVWRQNEIIKNDTAVRQITSDEREMPNFIFMGKAVPITAIDIPEVVRTLGELLALYCFVESRPSANGVPQLPHSHLPFAFREGVTIGKSDRSKRRPQDSIDVELRSNQIKRILYEKLKYETGLKLGDEIPSGNGGKIDLVGSLPLGEFDFYEIKPAIFARHAIREALPQLLEYAFRRGGKSARRLIIVSQAPLDRDSDDFLATLRAKGFPIHYQQVSLV